MSDRMPGLERLGELGKPAAGIVRRLRSAGYDAYLAGGCVRDMLLGRIPEDIDIATSARPAEIRRLFPWCLAVGESFGVMIVCEAGRQFEVATFRSESAYEDGRHPGRVEFSDARHDVERRDFTINGMLFDPIGGEVIDYVGGRDDLARCQIRAIGNAAERFEEDHLRMLRAVRFAAQFAFEIEPQTFQAICTHASSIQRISAERIRDELRKMLGGPHPGHGLRLLEESGLLHVILPEVAELRRIPLGAGSPGDRDVLEHCLAMLDFQRGGSDVFAFAVLLHDVGKSRVAASPSATPCPEPAEEGTRIAVSITRRLRFSGDEIRALASLVSQQSRFGTVQDMPLSDLKRFLRQEWFREMLELHRLDCLASHGDLSNWDYCTRRLDQLPPEVLWPPRLMDGNDLIALGLAQGPQFKEILDAIETAQLDEVIRTREDALHLVRSRWLEDKTTPQP